MDRIVRRLIDKVTGEPLTGKAVAARPSTGGTEVPMPESAGGYYGTVDEVAHGEYRIFVEQADSGDTVVVEPARTKRPGTTETCLIDKILQDKVRLSAFLDDDADVATHDNLVQALNQAAGSGRELIIDRDIEVTSDISVTGDLRISADGHTITTSGGAINCTGTLFMLGGSVSLGIYGIGKYTNATFVCVSFSGSDIQNSQVNNGETYFHTYLSCPGITEAKQNGTGIRFSSILGGRYTANADRLSLSDRESDTGDGRLIELQDFIDTKLPAIAATAAEGGVNSPQNQYELLRWINTPDAVKTSISTAGSSVGVYAVNSLQLVTGIDATLASATGTVFGIETFVYSDASHIRQAGITKARFVASGRLATSYSLPSFAVQVKDTSPTMPASGASVVSNNFNWINSNSAKLVNGWMTPGTMVAALNARAWKYNVASKTLTPIKITSICYYSDSFTIDSDGLPMMQVTFYLTGTYGATAIAAGDDILLDITMGTKQFPQIGAFA